MSATKKRIERADRLIQAFITHTVQTIKRVQTPEERQALMDRVLSVPSDEGMDIMQAEYRRCRARLRGEER